MKTRFTYFAFRYISFTCVFAFLSLNLFATSYSVTVKNYEFSPKELTITVGDEVTWTNSDGNHNVNGAKATFPNNPDSFGNDVGSNWTYKFTFNTAGTYDYQCDPHAAFGMIGKIIVNPKTVTSSQTLADGNEKIKLYPNPASQYMQILVPPNYAAIRSVKVYTIAGSIVDEKSLSGNEGSIPYDISHFKNGVYLMEITAGNERNVLKFIKQ